MVPWQATSAGAETVGVMSLPQASVTAGGTGSTLASARQFTVVPPSAGTVKSVTFIVIVCVSVAVWPQLSVIVNVLVTVSGQAPLELSTYVMLERLASVKEPPSAVNCVSSIVTGVSE